MSKSKFEKFRDMAKTVVNVPKETKRKPKAKPKKKPDVGFETQSGSTYKQLFLGETLCLR